MDVDAVKRMSDQIDLCERIKNEWIGKEKMDVWIERKRNIGRYSIVFIYIRGFYLDMTVDP